jgi:hypothetical protein
MIVHTITEPAALHAIRAAANWRIWGRFAAVRYCQRHGVPIALLRIARQLHVVYAEGF